MSQKPAVGFSGEFIGVQVFIQKLRGKRFAFVNLIQDIYRQMAD
jgi:hypothetical protein